MAVIAMATKPFIYLFCLDIAFIYLYIFLTSLLEYNCFTMVC